MASELSGTNCLLYRFTGSDDAVLVGQIEISIPFVASNIEITSKSSADFIELMNGELSTKGRSISGAIIYSNDPEYRLLRTNTALGNIGEYMVDIGGERLRFFGIPGGISDTTPAGDKITTSFTILSVGEEF